MARDSLFGEAILWSGRPKVERLPRANLLAALALGVVSVVSVGFAVVVATGLHARASGLVVLAAWCATLALGAWRFPLWWSSGVEYFITEKHVIVRRGRFRRTIERDAVSYARVHWIAGATNVGDLVLVRAVPTGALRRTLHLTLEGLEAPDRVLALVRGVTPSAPLGTGARPLAQRLDDGERVLWTAIQMASPWTTRRAATALGALALAGAAVLFVVRAWPPIRRVLSTHALPPFGLAAFLASVALAVLLLVAVAAIVAYEAWVRPRALARSTRYLVTNRRVLIHRADEELSLDRSRIAYVIDAPAGAHHDVFLVLDGPRARAFAPSGAFGGGDHGLLSPVLSSIDDAETVSALLAPTASLPEAA